MRVTIDGAQVTANKDIQWIAQYVQKGTRGTIYFRIVNNRPVCTVKWEKKRDKRGYVCVLTNLVCLDFNGRSTI